VTAGGVGDGAVTGRVRLVICPECGRRYRLDEERLRAGRRLRCGSCQHVFSMENATPSAAGPLVLIGDGDREFRNLLRRTLESLGCRVEVTDDGEAAFRFAVAKRPALMVLNVYLRNLLGVAVCEGIKRSPDLKGTKVALMGSVFKSERFVRNPGGLYGADDYFEDVIPAADMRERFLRLLGRSSPGARELADPSPEIPGESRAHRPEGRAGESLEPDAEIRRLARIMISDLKIYHPEGFKRALVERTFTETFREELTQAKDLITHRFPDLPDRLRVLSEGLREALSRERAGAASGEAGSPA
jgi:predicted Zn finger-like uncharacterized protein